LYQEKYSFKLVEVVILIGHMTQFELLVKIRVFGVLGQERRFLVVKDTKFILRP
jgi:hypothetical protein